VPEESLLTANSVSAPLGSVATLLGGLVGLATTVGLGDGWRWVCLVVAALGAGIGAALAAGFRADALGPDRPTESMGAAFRGYFGGLRDAAVSLWRTRGPAAALGAMAAARLAFGLVMMAAILITRNLLHPGDVGAALATFTVVLGVSAAGFAAAAILTPLAHARFSPRAWTVVSLGLAAASGLVLATSSALPVLLAGAFLLSLGVQNAKLAADTIVQQGVADDIRGWAFSIYDMLFNGALVLAAAIGALVLPATGYSVPLFLAVAAFYALTAWAYGAVSRQRT
jgi:MFS family permease